MNDAIAVDRCHMHYTSVLEAAAAIRHLGKGSLLAKIDLHQAYRMVPVHADDHPLLGIQWQDNTFVDTALPFGLRSAPKIFSAFADVLQIDTQEMTLSLPEEKQTRILCLVLSWRCKQTASKRELQSLIGHLSHAAMVVLPGRMFLRQMIDLMKTAKHPSHHIRLTAGFRSNLHWWASFLPWWNGRSIMPPGDPAHVVTSDASGSWGCGALTDAGQWFQVQWPESWAGINIAAKEMVPVVISVAIWGQEWASHQIQVRSDNMAVVHALTAGTARDPLLMHLLRCLHFFTATHQIRLEARHVAGIHNVAADTLSRNKMMVFLDSSPQAH